MAYKQLGLCALFLLSSACSEAYSPVPQGVKPPPEKKSIPDCRPGHAIDEEGFSTIVEALRRNGEVARTTAFYGRVRKAVETRLAMEDPTAPARLKPALDAFFSGTELEKRAVCAFARFDRAQPEIEAWEAWSLDPAMRAVHAGIFDASPFAAAGATSTTPERRVLLVRIVDATGLGELIHAEALAQIHAIAIGDVAVDPASSAQVELSLGGTGLRPPSEAVLVDRMLASRLQGVSDADLLRYLAFAESREGRLYFQTLREGIARAPHEWYPRLAEALRGGVRSPEIEEDPDAAAPMIADARRLLDEVGTRTVVGDARTLLLNAVRLDPKNAQIHALLGRVALMTRRSGIPYEDLQIRDRIDRTHPARPEDYAEAEAHLRKAIELDPDNAEAQLYLGRIHFQLSQDDKAAAQIAIARRLDPKEPGLTIFEADLAYATGDYAKAERLYRRVLAEPERRAFNHHFALQRLRYALVKQGREREFRQVANAQLARRPDLWDFRLQHAERLLATDGSADEVAALIEPVPERWLPDRKRGVLVRLQLLRAGQGAAAARPRAVARAFEIAASPLELIDATCASRVRTAIAAEVIRASGMQARFADHLLACALWQRDPAFVDAVLPLVERIDGPNEAMDGGPPLCSAAVVMDPAIFERLLKAKADPARRCNDGKTVRELLAERATRTDAEPDFIASNRALLKILDRYERRP